MSSRDDLRALAGCFQGRLPMEIDWLAVLDLANRSLITPRLAMAVEGRAGVPDDVARFLQDVLRRNTNRNLALTAQLAEATVSLNRAGIRPILLKGAAGLLAQTPLSSRGRMLCDLDLLVRPGDIDDAIKALEQAGYSIFSRRQGQDLHAVAELVRDGDWAMIDLHQRPPGPPGMAEIAALPARCRETAFEGAVALVPNPTVQLFLITLHDQFHDGDYWSGRLNLRHLLDICDLLISGDGIDWPALDALVRTPVVRNALETQLVDTHWLTGAGAPIERRRRLWPRLQHWRRLEQVSRPIAMLPFALLTTLVEASNLLSHRRENRTGRRRLFVEDAIPAAGRIAACLSRMRDILAAPMVGKL